MVWRNGLSCPALRRPVSLSATVWSAKGFPSIAIESSKRKLMKISTARLRSGKSLPVMWTSDSKLAWLESPRREEVLDSLEMMKSCFNAH